MRTPIMTAALNATTIIPSRQPSLCALMVSDLSKRVKLTTAATRSAARAASSNVQVDNSRVGSRSDLDEPSRQVVNALQKRCQTRSKAAANSRQSIYALPSSLSLPPILAFIVGDRTRFPSVARTHARVNSCDLRRVCWLGHAASFASVALTSRRGDPCERSQQFAIT